MCTVLVTCIPPIDFSKSTFSSISSSDARLTTAADGCDTPLNDALRPLSCDLPSDGRPDLLPYVEFWYRWLVRIERGLRPMQIA